ncbi:ribbon-helix-helix protein, CopG family [Thalassomonas actiniarum]|uniref:Ribbon-helix-helix protein, CopG family n=1 Tax=Thalassomonas actiniarum TaxID=485447 RepID=A0AAE9YUP2_9GAMM|nr:ribbon-helix-helix protein, CopG family [Thalassomonas actiniarum]WDD99827.1 ribbon-helix-helix protein, CopG family [Thalassomonas actiniarum]
MKKIDIITVRVDTETGDALRTLAQADERSVAWIARRLITEALETRKRLKSQDDKQHETDEH